MVETKAYSEIIKSCGEQMTSDGFKDVTKKDYLFHINAFLCWLESIKLCISDTSYKTIVKYIAWKDTQSIKNREKKLSQNTINSIKAALRFLYAKVLDEPEIAARIKGKKPDEREPITINPESLPKVFEEARRFYKRDEYKSQRAYYLLTFLYQSGARITEALNCVVDDINFSEGNVKLFGKNHEYYRNLDKEWVREFKSWLKRNNIEKYIFVNRDGKKMPLRTAQWLVSNITLKSTGKNYSPHKFRATCITDRLRSGEEYFSVSSNFHTNPNTTKKYIGASGRDLKNMKNPFTEMKKGEKE